MPSRGPADAGNRDRQNQRRQQLEARGLLRVVLLGGIGSIRFGMSVEQVRAGMGDSPAEGCGDGQVELAYDDPRFRFIFADVPGRGLCLVTIMTDDEPVELAGVRLTGLEHFRTACRLSHLGVHEQSRGTGRYGIWMNFSKGLSLHGSEYGDTVTWTIVPSSGRLEAIDWSGREAVG